MISARIWNKKVSYRKQIVRQHL